MLYSPFPMPSVKVQVQTTLNTKESFKKVSDLLANDSDLRKLDPKYEAKFDAGSLSGTATGSMFKAKMNVAENGGGSKVEIVVDLPLYLAMAKGMVEKTLQKKLTEAFA
jgi:hypothetical protein